MMSLRTTRARHWLLLGAMAAVGAAVPGRAETAEATIAKARAYLGSEAALSAVSSIHFVGTMQEFFGDDAKPVDSTVEIIFQKPYQQCIERVFADRTETTGLDDLEAWVRTQDRAHPDQWRLTLLAPDFVKRLRANTWENLNFYQGIERRGGSVQVVGPAVIDGVTTVKVAFVHEPGIVFIRYFDPATGRLVLTETEQGGRIQEEGEIMAGGIRFPAKVTTTTTSSDPKAHGGLTRMVITFSKVTLNEVFPDSRFAVPAMPPPRSAGAAPPPAR